MVSPQGALQYLTGRLYGRLLRLYPPRFRREFAGEIHAVFLDRMDEPGIKPGCVIQEMAGLVWSILRERWHEWRTRKEDEMATEFDSSNEGGAAVLRSTDLPASDSPWMLRWIFLLPLVILPVTLFASIMSTLPYQWILGLGMKLGLWPAVSAATLKTLGMMTSLALATAGAQWFMLRNLLPRPGRWFAATAIGLWLGGIAVVLLDLEGLVLNGRKPYWSHPFELLAVGLILGLSHWFFLRQQIKRAFWFLPIDLIAVISLFPIQIPIDNYIPFLLLFVPEIILGFGLWGLLRYTTAKKLLAAQTTFTRTKTTSTLRWLGFGLALFFFGGLWVNATVLLENAKARGAYPTLEEAVLTKARQAFEGEDAKILSLSVDESSLTPAILNGKRQHVRWGCANVVMDRIPTGHRWTSFPICTQYVHTREGWVLMGEGYSPFVGFVMELYNLEGVRQFQAGRVD